MRAVLILALVACASDPEPATDIELHERVPCGFWNGAWEKNPDNVNAGCEAPCESVTTLTVDDPIRACPAFIDGSVQECGYSGTWRDRRGCCQLTGDGAVFYECLN